MSACPDYDGVTVQLGPAPEPAVVEAADLSKRYGQGDAQVEALRDVLLEIDLFYGLLALPVVVSLFGMVNTLVLAVFERTRELGMLRAIGMSRWRMRRMIRYESVITALIGAAAGIGAAVVPARRAARLNVLAALQYE